MIAGWDIDVRPDGMGLPDGEGSVAEVRASTRQSARAVMACLVRERSVAGPRRR